MNIQITYFLAFLAIVNGSDPEVTTSFGTIRGSKRKIREKFVDEYLGIPYAKPPVATLRFAKPQEWTQKWSEPLVATKLKPSCYQFSKTAVSEDCLYLSIWTPSNRKDSKLLPVMFWIHGGGFASGSGSHIFGGVLSAFANVVVVSINYRLNAFGFLFGNHDEVPGNVGLYDQALALKWVKENIAKFGGDPNMVTIFGESAGGWSVSLHLLSPISKPYFQRAIAMSGTAMDYLGVDSKEWAFKRAKALSNAIGCVVPDDASSFSVDHIKCIRSKDAPSILKATQNAATATPRLVVNFLRFLPIFNEDFIPKSPRQMWKDKSFKTNCSLLIGTVFTEFELQQYIPPNGLPSLWTQHSFKDFPSQFLTKEQSNQLTKLYFTGIDEIKNRNVAKQIVTQLYGDITFHCPAEVFGDMFSEVNSNSVYQYVFNYKSKKDNPICDHRFPCHGSEIPFTFGAIVRPEDINPSLGWMYILSHFAKTGTTFWQKYNRTAEKRLIPYYYEYKGNGNMNNIQIGFRYFYCQIWKSMVFK